MGWSRKLGYPLGSVLSLALFVTPACDDHDEFRSDVMHCEEAVAYLKTCCAPSSSLQIRCDYDFDYAAVPAEPNHCGGGPGCSCASDRTTLPDLAENESRCVLAHACSNLEPSGICAKVRAHHSGLPAEVCK